MKTSDVLITPARADQVDRREMALEDLVFIHDGKNGVMVAGRTVLDAFDRLQVLEATAAATIRRRELGPISAKSPEVIQQLLEAFPSL
jgi:ribulose-5-phosphate 4-epimerase/fuculose-1-phosphate aldolase